MAEEYTLTVQGITDDIDEVYEEAENMVAKLQTNGDQLQTAQLSSDTTSIVSFIDD